MSKLSSGDEEVKDLTPVILAYRLVRNVVITHNWTKMKKEDDKRVVPEELQSELMGLLGTEVYSKFVEALKLTSSEVTKVLPEKLDAKVTDSLVKWCDQKEKVVIADLEKVIEECSAEITARKDEPKPAKRKSPKAASKKSVAKDGAPEEKFRDLMNQVRDKVKKIKLGQNDF